MFGKKKEEKELEFDLLEFKKKEQSEIERIQQLQEATSFMIPGTLTCDGSSPITIDLKPQQKSSKPNQANVSKENNNEEKPK